MKCDKLRYDYFLSYNINGNFHGLAYIKEEVDEAIAELKEKYKKLTKDHDHAIQACCDADKAIAKLEEEIKKTQEIANEQTFKLYVEKENVWQLEVQLLEKKQEIENLKNSHYAEMTDLGMDNYKLEQQLRKQKIKL